MSRSIESRKSTKHLEGQQEKAQNELGRINELGERFAMDGERIAQLRERFESLDLPSEVMEMITRDIDSQQEKLEEDHQERVEEPFSEQSAELQSIAQEIQEKQVGADNAATEIGNVASAMISGTTDAKLRDAQQNASESAATLAEMKKKADTCHVESTKKKNANHSRLLQGR